MELGWVRREQVAAESGRERESSQPEREYKNSEIGEGRWSFYQHGNPVSHILVKHSERIQQFFKKKYIKKEEERKKERNTNQQVFPSKFFWKIQENSIKVY